ncbi:hypothetical protein, partial [Paraburkholderia sp.]|uniref:hypothetical protein n=1 Tax=Paraburkholderia sp. TaxID=1926495 RepID=UPI002D71DB78
GSIDPLTRPSGQENRTNRVADLAFQNSAANRRRKRRLLQRSLSLGSMAILNVAVSFALAFYMAVKSRDLRRNAVRSLRGAIWQRVFRHPLELVWPAKTAPQGK